MGAKPIILSSPSILKKDKESCDYMDIFQSLFAARGQNPDITTILKLFLSSGPKWGDTLFVIRDKVVGLFGFKTSKELLGEQKQINAINYEPGEQLGIFKLFDKTANEIILGEDDKHLNFRVSLSLDPTADKTGKRKLTITTMVKFNNWVGRLYFLPVKPFHKLIVRSTLKEMIQRIENGYV